MVFSVPNRDLRGTNRSIEEARILMLVIYGDQLAMSPPTMGRFVDVTRILILFLFLHPHLLYRSRYRFPRVLIGHPHLSIPTTLIHHPLAPSLHLPNFPIQLDLTGGWQRSTPRYTRRPAWCRDDRNHPPHHLIRPIKKLVNKENKHDTNHKPVDRRLE